MESQLGHPAKIIMLQSWINLSYLAIYTPLPAARNRGDIIKAMALIINTTMPKNPNDGYMSNPSAPNIINTAPIRGMYWK